jgi:hypothetical protein
MMVTCTHGAPAQPLVNNPRIKLSGSPAPQAGTLFSVQGCPFVMGVAGPKPCLTGTYAPPTLSARVKSMGMGLIVQSSATQPATVTPGAPPLPFLPISNTGQVRVKAM